MCYVVFDVLLGVEGYGGEADGFARPPADTLEGEDGVGVVGEGFVLGMLAWLRLGWRGLVGRCLRGDGLSTYHDPLTAEVFESDFCWSGHCD